MNAIVELSQDCEGHWVPSQQQCEDWLSCGLLIAEADTACCISLSFVDIPRSQSLNKDYRGRDKPTNVLSFPAEFPAQLQGQVESYPLGDIVICPAIVEREASEQGKPLAAHWAHLTVHGLFHLLGHEHDNEECASVMEQLEINTLERLGIPNPYLIG